MKKTAFKSPAVAAYFEQLDQQRQEKLLQVRELIFHTACQLNDASESHIEKNDIQNCLNETLKWGQPVYLNSKPRTGTTIRLGLDKSDKFRYGIFFHCQTSLIESCRAMFSDFFEFEGNRALLLDCRKEIPQAALRHCITLALTYHKNKK